MMISDSQFENTYSNQARADYHKLFKKAGLKLEATFKPLGYNDEPYDWVSETKIAPRMIFVLSKTKI